jgi:fatty-acyl-CoA synthase
MVLKLGGLLLLAVLGLGVIGLLLAVLVKPRRGWGPAMVAIVIPVVALAFVGSVISKAKTIPPIHDISTNVTDPPAYSETVVAERAKVPGGNGVDSMSAPMGTLKQYATMPALADKTVGGLGHAANPDLSPLTLKQSVADATTLAADVAKAQGLTVVRTDPAAGTVEATAQSFWFGFKDDFAVRVRPSTDGAGAVLDVRSTSRVGQSDLGANAKRIRAYLAAVKAKAGA